MKTIHKLAYAAPAIGVASVNIPLQVYLPPFYADHVGMPLGMIGIAFLIVRLLDIGFDPLIGVAMDRLSSKWGRFKPWLAGGAMLMVIAAAFLFMPPAGVGTAYLIAFLVLIYAGYSICSVAQLGWGCTLSVDRSDRNSIFAYWQAASLAGVLVSTTLPILPVTMTGLTPVALIGWFLILSIPIGTVIALFGAPEIITGPTTRPRLSAYLRLLAKPLVARLLLTDLLVGMAVFNGGALFFFYMATRHQIGMAQGALMFFLINFGALVGSYIWAMLGDRMGKKQAASFAFLCYAASLPAYHYVPLGNPLFAGLFVFAFGLSLAANPVLVRSMLADAGDHIQREAGQDHTGLLAALFTNSNKLGAAIGPAISFILLDWSGFRADAAAQSETASTTLYALAIWAPFVIALFSTWFIRGHPLGLDRANDTAMAGASATA